MIHIEGSFRVPDLEKARPRLEQLVRDSRAEEGCIGYYLAPDLLDPNLVCVNERWESLDAFKAHAAAEHFLDWRKTAETLGVSDRSIRLYSEDPMDL